MLLILNEHINSYVSLSVISKSCFSVVVPQTEFFFQVKFNCDFLDLYCSLQNLIHQSRRETSL